MNTLEIIIMALGLPLGVILGFAFSRHRRRHRNKIEPKAPWDGVHQLENIKYFEWHASMDEFHTGWIWKCACGIGNDHLYWRLPHNEELAIAEYKKHKQHYTDLEQSFGS